MLYGPADGAKYPQFRHAFSFPFLCRGRRVSISNYYICITLYSWTIPFWVSSGGGCQLTRIAVPFPSFFDTVTLWGGALGAIVLKIGYIMSIWEHSRQTQHLKSSNNYVKSMSICQNVNIPICFKKVSHSSLNSPNWFKFLLNIAKLFVIMHFP